MPVRLKLVLASAVVLLVAAAALAFFLVDPVGDGSELPAVGKRSERPVRGHLTGTACQRLAERAGQLAGADNTLAIRTIGTERALVDLARGGTNRIVGRGFRPEYDDGSSGQVRHFVGFARASMFGGVQPTRWISQSGCWRRT